MQSGLGNLDDSGRIEAASRKIKQCSKRLYSVFSIVFWAALFGYLVMIVATIGGGIKDYSSGLSAPLLTSVAKIVLELFIALFLIQIVRSMFQEMATGSSPFSMRQSKRLKIAACFQVLHAVVTALLSPAFYIAIGLGDAALGATVGMSPTEANMRFIPINMGDIVLAIVLFCAALIVEYGSLLQQLSDDTV